MSYYTERHGMRALVEQTETITYEIYGLIFDCCKAYFDNIAWKYPKKCIDYNDCCGLDEDKLGIAMQFEIPSLYRHESGRIDTPLKRRYPHITDKGFSPYGLLDFVEFEYRNIKDIANKSWHEIWRHNDLTFNTTRETAYTFRTEINHIFETTGLIYTLTESGMIERIPKNGVLSKEIETDVTHVPEKGLRGLLLDAIILYKTPKPQARQDSVEKIWDALERLKSYYTTMDKKNSAAKIVNDMANNQSEFASVFNEEFRTLSKIGNDFQIRHHETNKIDIADSRHYDYFFNRCLSLIALAVQYLK